MPLLPLRTLDATGSTALLTRWVGALDERLRDPSTDRAVLCRETLAELAWPQYAASWSSAVEDEGVPMATRLALLALDPRHITLEPEYYADCDPTQFQPVKPLLWLWYAFDRGDGRRAPPHARAAHLPSLRPRVQVLPTRGVLVRLQPGGRR